jgi:hypothetical protein
MIKGGLGGGGRVCQGRGGRGIWVSSSRSRLLLGRNWGLADGIEILCVTPLAGTSSSPRYLYIAFLEITLWHVPQLPAAAARNGLWSIS